MFDYKTSTKNAYRSPSVAKSYHDAFSGRLGWRFIRFGIVAACERIVVRALADQIRPKRVLDVPCGTGKLAKSLVGCDASITAADISPQMLEIARVEYSRVGLHETVFLVADVEELGSAFTDDQFDVVICLRLMHRVPKETRSQMLDQIAAVARYAIVSFGVDSSYHRGRRWIRHKLFGGGTKELCTETKKNIVNELSNEFDILESRWVLPFLSEEHVFLLRRKAITDRPMPELIHGAGAVKVS